MGYGSISNTIRRSSFVVRILCSSEIGHSLRYSLFCRLSFLLTRSPLVASSALLDERWFASGLEHDNPQIMVAAVALWHHRDRRRRC